MVAANVLPRKVLLGVTGGIAAYKAPMLVRALVKAGAEVQVVMTPAAHDFVSPLVLSTLSKRPALTEFIDHATWNDHVHLARWADVMLIAPATANTLAKMAQGLCDDLLLACWLSAECPVFVAPAMDLEMYRDAATQANLEILRGRGMRTIGPESGELASGLIGEGRMTEPDAIVEALVAALIANSPLAGKRILITAGPTQEAIDPVRYIGNRSSGKMGFAIAEEAAWRGAQVQLVTGPVGLDTIRPGIQRTNVVSAAEMSEACKTRFNDCDIAILSAAVADWRPAHQAAGKMKKRDGLSALDLEATEDILGWMGGVKRTGQLLVGFALETDDERHNAEEKLARKNLDLIVLNSLRDAGAGFGHDTNKVTLIDAGTNATELPLMSKRDVARAILDRIENSTPMLRKALALAFIVSFVSTQAQEFNCKVSVIAPKIQSTPDRVWKSMETSITELMNTHRWTALNFSPEERIDCNMLLTINQQTSADAFSGTLQVIYSRPVYGSDYMSPVIDILDNDLQFNYLENTKVDFSIDRFTDNLSSVIAFYAYYILGVDEDTFSPMGGTDLYAQAQTVVSNAQNASQPGWKAFEGEKNRYWLVDNQLQGAFRPMRQFLYDYHRNGFDKMATNMADGRKACASAIDELKAVHQAKPSSYNLQVIFNAKYNELVQLFKSGDPQERAKVYNTLQIIDPGHINQYLEMMKGGQ